MREAATRMAHGQATGDSQALAVEGARKRSMGDYQTRPMNGRRQSGDGLGRPKQPVQEWRRSECVGPGDDCRARKWQYMQCGVLPQAQRLGARVRMLVHQPTVSVIQMQSLVIMVVVTVALGMDRHVVQLGRPMGRNPGGEERSRLPDDSQHQQECANRARHARSLTGPSLFHQGTQNAPTPQGYVVRQKGIDRMGASLCIFGGQLCASPWQLLH